MEIYTDGSNTYNGKPYSFGGYGWVIVYDGQTIEGGGSLPVDYNEPVTNNRAELMAIISALEMVYENKLFLSDKISIRSDSQWCVKCGNLEWKRLKNRDLWNRFSAIEHKFSMKRIKIELSWVRGHVGNEYNELADQLAGFYADLVRQAPPLESDPKTI